MKSLAIAAGIVALSAGQVWANPSQMSEAQLDDVVAGTYTKNSNNTYTKKTYNSHNRNQNAIQVGIGNQNGDHNSSAILSNNQVSVASPGSVQLQRVRF